MSQFGTLQKLTISIPSNAKVSIRHAGRSDGYDGHSLRAYSYWPHLLTGIENTVASINSIKKKFDDIRSLSKAPTFLLTYGGSYRGLMKNCGFTEQEAKAIEEKYHTLYAVSDAWVAEKLQVASKVGYVEVAFGLRLRTPMLAKSVLGTRSTPKEAAGEGRTAGNALGQSYGLLNNRAANEFMQRVRASKHRHSIKLCAMIHDAIYLLIKNELGVIQWVNENLTDCMSWQELPELHHDTVKIHAELDLFYPNWGHGCTLLPTDTIQDIHRKAVAHHEAL